MVAALIIFIVAFLFGFLCGFTTYSLFIMRAIRTGRAYVKDKFGKWYPNNPFIRG